MIWSQTVYFIQAALLSFNITCLLNDYDNALEKISVCRISVDVFDFLFMFSVQISGRDFLDVITQITDRNLLGME